jgi:hypothetical protein
MFGLIILPVGTAMALAGFGAKHFQVEAFAVEFYAFRAFAVAARELFFGLLVVPRIFVLHAIHEVLVTVTSGVAALRKAFTGVFPSGGVLNREALFGAFFEVSD